MPPVPGAGLPPSSGALPGALPGALQGALPGGSQHPGLHPAAAAPQAISQPIPQPVAIRREPSRTETLLMEAARKLARKDASLFWVPDVPEKKIHAAAQTYAALTPGDFLLCLQDSTVLGSAKEGLLVTTQGISWNGINGSGRGSLRFDQLNAATVGIVFSTGMFGEKGLLLGTHKVPLNGIEEPTLQALAALLRKGARLADGSDPEVALPRADELLAAGNIAEAVKVFRALLQEDTALVAEVLPRLRKAVEQFPTQRLAATYLAELETQLNDPARGWYIQSARTGAIEGPCTREELQVRWKNAKLFPDDLLRHFGDRDWQLASDAPPLSGERALCFRDPGDFQPTPFGACWEALARRGVSLEKLLFFGNTLTRLEKVAGQPLIHLALTESGVVVLAAPQEGEVQFDLDGWESATWSLAPPSGTQAHWVLSLTTSQTSYEISLRPGPGLTTLLERTSRLFLVRAEANFAAHKYFAAEKLTNQIPLEHRPPAVADLLARMGKVAEVLAFYDGGHPAYTEKALGSLRLDEQGLEFAPLLPGGEMYLRLPYEQLLEVLPPQRGNLPEDIVKNMGSKRRTLGILRAGLGVAAAAVIPGGGLLVGGLSGLMGGGGNADASGSLNRLCLVVLIDGTRYRLFFDTFAQDKDQLATLAKTFWNNAARVQNRFAKSASPSDRAAQGSGSAQQVQLLKEIRDLLRQLVALQSGTLLPGPPSPDTTGPAALPSLASADPVTRPPLAPGLAVSSLNSVPDPLPTDKPVVVGCPKCSTKLRVRQPGVVACPSCAARVRVSDALFARGA